MDTQKQILIEQRITNDKKSNVVAYLLWFFLGAFSAHRFYLGKTGSAVAQLILIFGGALLSAAIIGLPMLIVGLIWLLVDAFLIPGMTEAHTQSLRSQLTSQMAN